MTRGGERGLLADVQRLKRERTVARQRAEKASALIKELRGDVIRVCVAGRLLRSEDFWTFIGVDKVLTEDGRVDVQAVRAEVTMLLRIRPELGVTSERQ